MSRHWILLVDPLKNLLYAYRTILESEGYGVKTAANPTESLNHLATRRFSVVITEFFPPQGAYDFIREAKQKYPETYIIMVTNAVLDERTYENLFASGVDDLIVKPYSPERILVHVKKGLLQRELILKKREAEEQVFLDLSTKEFVYNSGYFMKTLRQELKRARRHQHPLSLLIIEVPTREKLGDRFEPFCAEIARVLRKNTREEDVVGREDGNFGILLPETDQAGSKAVVERLSNLLKTHSPFKAERSIQKYAKALSILTFTYPQKFILPRSLTTIVEEVQREYPAR